MIFAAFYLTVLLLVYIEARGLVRPQRLRTMALPAWAYVLTLVLSYALQIALETWAARRSPAPPHVLAIAIVTRAMPHPSFVAAATLLLAAVQSYALLALYRSRVDARAVGAACGVLLALSVGAPALTNGDIYAYVGNALLGGAAYAPPNAPFSGEYAVINDMWHTPMTATTYGPLWLIVVRIVTAAAPTLTAKLFALRAYGALLFVALLAILRALGMPARILTVVALNPAMQLEFVANAHNDMTAVVAIALAATFARTRPSIAAGLIAVAGLVKLPYAVLGLPVLAAVRAPRTRAVAALAACIAVAIVSAIGGGAPYVHALTAHVAGSPEQDAIHVIAALAALTAIGVALAGGRRLLSAVWLMPSLGAYVDSWYVMWGFPYALGRRRILGAMAIWFPIVAAVVDLTLVQVWTAPLVAAVIAAYLAARWPRRSATA